MNAKLISYSVKHLTIGAQNQLRKALNGHNDVSHGRKYSYRRAGILDTLLHIKPSRSTIIAPTKEAALVIQLLQKHQAEFKTYSITISSSEFKK